MPPDFDEVQLTESQIDELIYQERLGIYFKVVAEQKKNLAHNEKVEAARWFNAEELAEYILLYNPEFVLDEYTKPIFNLLCLYFTRDKRFEEYGSNFSLYKGIALAGNPGVGKSEMMKVFQINKRKSYLLIDMDKIQEQCKGENKFDQYKKFVAEVPGWGNLKKYFYQDYITWCLDDVGKEEMLVDYGNKALIFSKIIEYRSSPNNRQLLQYYPMHITTMLTAEDFGNKYGDFVKSRMREQFNWIPMEGNDRRK